MKTFGISAALLTPFSADGQIDLVRLVQHARDVLKNGAAGVTIFGTTGEGASVSSAERTAGLRHLVTEGIPTASIIQTIYATSVVEAAAQTADGLAIGVSSFLLVPPFFFKDCSDEGLFDWHAQLFARADPRAKFVLYHIPQVTGVALSVHLVGRLTNSFPNRLLAVKDSSGDWDNATKLLALDVIPVLVGDERLLHRASARGGAGAITGMANLYPGRIRHIFESATEDVAISAEVTRIVTKPVIPALKALLGRQNDDPDWDRVRAPLKPLSAEARRQLGI
ncbi:dihydrodipicolinate synthase family protein [Boseongicola aestuarii]|uniref:4-hydroxy-tetrahydrodipicolinate synthase n=1 Tax=Boseongicola aestuarii TaxID=1470561 RepID=A0A238J3Y6_9RHOB|nr:dihydrodipicolinate synthase family protein [Boseongicola aestuarii]SMX25459.1 4-hydroxy-tetrahydrodipicolinate synthase [Boseongicola aestuarii]